VTGPGGLADRLARLSPEQRAVLRRRLGAAADTGPELRPHLGDRSWSPLGLDQERLWILEQLYPGSVTYNISAGLRFVGRLDVAALTAALNAVIQRHELLRSSIEVRDRRPVLIVSDESSGEVEFVDLRAASERLEEAVRTFVRRPFDLAEAGLLRVAVFRTAEAEYHVIESMHHAVTDHWSFGRLNEELLEHYRAIVQGRPPRVSELPVQFGDFARWQRDHFSGERQRHHRDFWRDYLAGATGELALPYDAPRIGAGHEGRFHNFLLTPSVSAGFLRLQRTSRLTLPEALMAVYAALLYEETGQRDIIIGEASATRARPETYPLIGFLLTNTPVRIRLPEQPAPTHILGAAKAASAAVADHRQVPFSEIVAAASPTRSLDRHPLLQTMHVVLEFDNGSVEVPDADVNFTVIPDTPSPMDITVGWWTVNGQLFGRFEYRIDVFSATTIARLVRRLVDLVAEFVERPDRPLAVATPRRTVLATAARAGSGEAAVSELASTEDIDRVAAVWRSVLGRDVGIDDGFFDVGGTSLMAIQLAQALRAAGLTLTTRQVFSRPTIAGQVALLAAGSGTPQRPEPSGAVTFAQAEILAGGPVGSHTLVLSGAWPIDPSELREAVDRLVSAHPSLCTEFRRHGVAWQATAGSRWTWQVEEAGADVVTVAAGQRAAFDLDQGDLFAVSLLPGEIDRIVMSASDLVVDRHSWAVLIKDLAKACRGEDLRTEAVSSMDYMAALSGTDFTGQLAFWQGQQEPPTPLICIGGDESLETEYLRRMTPLGDAVSWFGEALAAVVRAVGSRVAGDDVIVDMVTPGRDFSAVPDWDPLNSVGCYTCTYPVRFSVADDVARALTRIPCGGRGYDVLRLSANPAISSIVRGWVPPEISFEYRGVTPGRMLAGPLGEVSDFRSGDSCPPRRRTLDILVDAEDGDLIFSWRYDAGVLAPAVVRSMADRAAEEFARLSDGRLGSAAGMTNMSLDAVNDVFAKADVTNNSLE
jgi:aryl carrier-like protein